MDLLNDYSVKQQQSFTEQLPQKKHKIGCNNPHGDPFNDQHDL